MNRPATIATALLTVGVVAASATWWSGAEIPARLIEIAAAQPASSGRTPLYYQDPDGKPAYAAGPRRTADGRDWVPVYEDGATASKAAAQPADIQRLVVAVVVGIHCVVAADFAVLLLERSRHERPLNRQMGRVLGHIGAAPVRLTGPALQLGRSRGLWVIRHHDTPWRAKVRYVGQSGAPQIT